MKPSCDILVVEVLYDSLYDESGVVCYQYGNMGEVVAETRVYALPFLAQQIALTTHFDYDSWGRMQYIIYPDHEVVRYHYDLGGQLCKIDNSAYYTYLDNVTYDRFGAKVSQEYGNGMVTNYSYNNLTRRLSIISTTNGNSSFSSQVYTYDPVGNVTQVVSASSWLQNMGLAESFTYDASDQLTSASETLYQSYQLSVNYGNWGKINSYTLNQKDLLQNTTQSEAQAYTYPVSGSLGDCQTLFAPEQRTITDANNNMATETLSFGINGSLRKREVQAQPQTSYTEYYLFNSAANLKAYSNNGLDFAYYGYNASNTRAYKLSMLNQNQWVNGQPEPIHLQLQSAMFYPNAYINFNQNGEYTKHYYNGSERICSRLGENTVSIAANSNDRFGFRIMQADQQARADLLELVEAEDVPIETPSVDVTSLQPIGTATDIFYYHTNHLGSTAFVTDQNQTVTQGFLYAPFGEITTEYAPLWQNGTLPKYSFNAKELDEETGMYYYEARYYKPPVFTSRDPMFEKYFWMTPYAYCANNPVKYVDPSGEEIEITFLTDEQREKLISSLNKITGLNLYVYTRGNQSYLCYAGTEAHPFIELNNNGECMGSDLARSILLDAINDKKTTVEINNFNQGSCVDPDNYPNTVSLDFEQIKNYENGAYGVDKETMGVGMVFFHEFFHTEKGGNLNDNYSGDYPGDVVSKVNQIRAELNALGGNYGQRMAYPSKSIPEGYFMPFDVYSYKRYKESNDMIPNIGTKFIFFQ